MSVRDSTRLRAVLALLLTMVFWGSGAVFLRTLALALSPENALALRYVILAVINGGALLMLGTWRVERADWGRFALAGLAGMGGYNWFVNAGFELVPAGLGTIVTSAGPLMIAVLAWMVLGEKLTRYIFIGLAVASLGAIVLFWDDLSDLGASTVSARGIVYLLISCACWAVYTIMAKPLLDRYSSFTVAAVAMLAAAPMLIAAASEPLPALAQKLDARQWGEMVYLVAFSSLLGSLLWNYGTKHLSGATTGAFLYLVPVIAVACGALVLGEPVTLNIVAGGLLMLAGVAVAQFGPRLRKTQLEPGRG
jgi:drug/metabolite transporter (DMT)-like permease